MATQTLSKREKRALRKRRAQRRRLLAGAAILGGLVLLLVGAGLWWQGRNVAASAFDYGPEDIAYDKPLHAVHEMGAGPPIPFLPSNGPQPRIAIDEPFYNFGSIGPSEVVKREFVIANLGEAPAWEGRHHDCHPGCGLPRCARSNRAARSHLGEQ